EWEPANGVLLAWPPRIPHKLIKELSKDVVLYILVENHTIMRESIQWLSKWGIMPNQVEFVVAPHGPDVSWTRDWGPHAVFAGSEGMRLVDGNYRLSTPLSGFACDDNLEFIFKNPAGEIIYTEEEDRLPGYVGPRAGIKRIEIPYAFTGGNVLADGQRTAFSSCII